MYDHLRYRYILAIEGNDVATNLKWVMSTNSLAVMPRPTYETWFMEGRSARTTIYVEIRPDYADLEERMHYYDTHPGRPRRSSRMPMPISTLPRRTARELISLLVLRRYFERTGSCEARISVSSDLARTFVGKCDIMLPGGRPAASGGAQAALLDGRRDHHLRARFARRQDRGLELGADDYLPKPFHLAELSARIRSVMRRHQQQAVSALRRGTSAVAREPPGRDRGRDVSCCASTTSCTTLWPGRTIRSTRRRWPRVSGATHIDQADNFDFVYAQMKNLRRKPAGRADIEIRAVYGWLQTRPAMKLVSRILLHLAWAPLLLNDRIEHEMDDALALRAETILTRYLAGACPTRERGWTVTGCAKFRGLRGPAAQGALQQREGLSPSARRTRNRRVCSCTLSAISMRAVGTN